MQCGFLPAFADAKISKKAESTKTFGCFFNGTQKNPL